ncbi:hypothetical protein CKO51_18055 [Rhodopirellula sp. SM50]|nr:hypothetical protein CKO51_18055 [Rhodopirellula sp. SM50]
MSSRGDEIGKSVSMWLDQRESTPPWPSTLPSWLAPCELEELNCFRAPNRRCDWISGRWCAKQLLRQMVSDATDSPLTWQILSRASMRRGCRPTVFRNGIQQPIDLSLAHCASITVAVAGQHRPSVDRRDVPRIGVDAVDRTELPDSFARTWFSSAERRLLQDHRWPIAAGWAAKEAVFKACNGGEAFRPGRVRMIEITAEGCTVAYTNHSLANVHINVVDDAIIAVALSNSLFRSPPQSPGRSVRSERGGFWRRQDCWHRWGIDWGNPPLAALDPPAHGRVT